MIYAPRGCAGMRMVLVAIATRISRQDSQAHLEYNQETERNSSR